MTKKQTGDKTNTGSTCPLYNDNVKWIQMGEYLMTYVPRTFEFFVASAQLSVTK